MQFKNLILLIAALSCQWASVTAEDVICPARNSTCSDLSTCCPFESGGYGCCPMPNAFCCVDKQHCCRNGYHCSGDVCLPDTMAQTFIEPNEKVICPDKTSTCPSGTTCCLIGSAFYGCCPLPEAVCCNDGHHCCPSGTVCDLAHETCNTPLIKETTPVAAIKLDLNVETIKRGIQCDDIWWCQDSFICCKPLGQDWSCCKMPKLDPIAQPWVKQIPTTPLISKSKTESIICPDGESQCPNGSTCCKLNTGEWGCCPLPQATCCDDGLHCCPHGNQCQSGRCLQRGISIPWFKKIKSTPVPQNMN